MPIKDRVDRAGRARAREVSLRAARGPQRELVVRVADMTARAATAPTMYLQQQIGPALAHELSQPLTAIANYASACARFLRANTPEAAQNALRAADAILAEAQRGAEIIRRVRSCLMDCRTAAESFDLAALLRAVVGKASPAATSAGVSIVCEGDLPTDVRADSILVGQVLLNLIYNAMDAIRDGNRGAGTIRIASHIRSDGLAEISVSDDGVGLSKAMAERIFEPAVTTKREGTGIGLTISRSIIEAHGGRLWAEPNQSCGTTFRFTLPAAAAA